NGSAAGGVSSGGLEGVSQSAIQMANHGAKAMALNALMKPAAAVLVAATLGVAGLVASEPEDQPAAGVAPGRAAINLQAAATELSPPTPPAVAGFTAPVVVDEKVADAGAPTRESPEGGWKLEVTRPQPVQFESRPVPRVVAPTGVFVPTPKPNEPLSDSGRKRLQLELERWQLRAEGLRLKAMAEAQRAGVLGRAVEEGDAPAADRIEALSARAESMLLQADAKSAEAKVLEINEQLKQPIASISFEEASIQAKSMTFRQPPPLQAPPAQPAALAPQINSPIPQAKPRPTPHRITVGDQLQVRVVGALPDQPISGVFSVEPSGTLALGPAYGRVNVVGMTLVASENAITEMLSAVVTGAQVQVTLAKAAGRSGWASGAAAQNYKAPAAYQSWPQAPRQALAVYSGWNEDERGAISWEQKPVRFSLGPKQFRKGDSIEITRVLASSPRLEPGDLVSVSCRVRLGSREAADVALELTQSGNKARTEPDLPFKVRIERGSKEFTLHRKIQVRGALHLTLYGPDGGKPFGGVYFGTKEQMDEITDMDLDYYLSDKQDLKNGVLSPGDQIVMNLQPLEGEHGKVHSMKTRIDRNGKINLLNGLNPPHVMNGTVTIKGMPPEAAARRIKLHLLEEWPDNPMQVTVRRMSSSIGESIRPDASGPTFFQQYQTEKAAFPGEQHAVRFVVGPKLFREGDSIEITNVLSSSPRLEPGDTVLVSGRVRLGSREAADVALELTQTGNRAQTEPDLPFKVRIERGTKEFTLQRRIQVRGALHLTLYGPDGGKPFGGVYFGTQEQMDEIADMDLGYYLADEESANTDSTASAAQRSYSSPPQSTRWLFSDPRANTYVKTLESKLSPGDGVFVVFKTPPGQGDYVGQQTVGPDGTINALHGLDIPRPVDDRIEIASKSREQAARDIQAVLKKYLPEMQAKVEVRVARKRSVFRPDRQGQQPVSRSRLEDPRQVGLQSEKQAMRQQAEQISQLQAQLAAREAMVMKQVHSLEAELRSRDREMQEHDALAQEMLAEVRKRNAEQAKQQAQVLKSAAATEKLKAELAKLQAELAKRDAELRRLKEQRVK
ncbi:MAG: polysaccharide biosynthesis/export family protein, partial [Planctomycetota bacterium]